MTLPPLPKPSVENFAIYSNSVYTKEQMLEYGAACRAAALEECAKVADDFQGDCVKPRKHLSPAGVECYRGGAIVAENIAATIRALK